ncbi:MAG: hypothetical protein ACHQFX_15995 [Chitinophagales bacterium]
MKTYCSIFCIILHLYSFAQKNFVPGIIITRQADTLPCLIDYRNWEKNPETITFKRDINSVEEALNAGQVQSFEITGKDYYESAVIWKDIQPVEFSQLETEDNNRIVKDLAFLRVLIKGEKLSLYQLVDEKEHYFIRERNDTLQELQYKVIKDPANPAMFVTKNIFRDQLKKYTLNNQTTKKVLNKIETAFYKEKDLANIITLLNSKVYYSSRATLKKQKTVSVFAGGGVSYNKLSFSGSDKSLNVLDFPATAGYMIVLGADAFAGKGSQKLFVRFEVSYRRSSFKGTATTDGFFPGEIEDRVYEIEVSSVNAAASLLYTFVKTGNSKLYAGLGGGYNFTTYPENTYTITNRTISTTTIKENYRDFDNKWAEVFLRAGFLINKHFETGLVVKIVGGFGTSADVNVKNPYSFFSLLYHF